MSLKILIQIAKKHKEWIYIVRSFGCNKHIAEDIVQEMYIKIQLKINSGLDIKYGKNDFNHSYVFKVLRTLFLDLKRKENKVSIISIDNINQKEVESDNIDYVQINKEIKEKVNTLFWYDKKVYEIIDNGSSIADLSRKTRIPYYSLYNTFKKVKDKLKKLL